MRGVVQRGPCLPYWCRVDEENSFRRKVLGAEDGGGGVGEDDGEPVAQDGQWTLTEGAG